MFYGEKRSLYVFCRVRHQEESRFVSRIDEVEDQWVEKLSDFDSDCTDMSVWLWTIIIISNNSTVSTKSDELIVYITIDCIEIDNIFIFILV